MHSIRCSRPAKPLLLSGSVGTVVCIMIVASMDSQPMATSVDGVTASVRLIGDGEACIRNAGYMGSVFTPRREAGSYIPAGKLVDSCQYIRSAAPGRLFWRKCVPDTRIAWIEFRYFRRVLMHPCLVRYAVLAMLLCMSGVNETLGDYHRDDCNRTGWLRK